MKSGFAILFVAVLLCTQVEKVEAAQIYEPASVEWLALISVGGVSVFAASILTLAAIGFGWKTWYYRLQTPHPHNSTIIFGQWIPSYFNPHLFAGMRIVIGIVASLAVFYAWKEGFRAEATGTISKAPSAVPSESEFFGGMLAYAAFLFFSFVSPLCFFGIGIPGGWVMLSFGLEFLAFAAAVTATVFFYYIRVIAGILMTVVSVWYAYSALVAWWMKGCYQVGFINDPLENIFHYIFKRDEYMKHTYGLVPVQHQQGHVNVVVNNHHANAQQQPQPNAYQNTNMQYVQQQQPQQPNQGPY